MAGSVREELWAWGFLRSMCLFADIIHLPFCGWYGRKRTGGAFNGVDDSKDFDILKNRWFRTLELLLMGWSLVVMEAFRNFCFIAAEL